LVKYPVFIGDLQGWMSSEGNPSQAEFDRQGFLLNRFLLNWL
jgi:hypothetical protein